MIPRPKLGIRVPVLIALAALTVAGALFWGSAAVAQTDESDATQSQPSKKELKEQAREERINEYLRKKEEKRVARAKELEQLEEQKALEMESQAAAAEPPPPAPAPAPQQATPEPVAQQVQPIPAPKKRKSKSALPKDLARAQATVRATAVADDPTVQSYLEMIDRQMASPHQLAAFGSFVAQNGMIAEGLVYYDVALRIEKTDPLLWVNAGTLHRQNNDPQGAISAYSKAIAVDPNNAFAYYNLGSVNDTLGNYDAAIAQYKTALALDPDLGDPAQNPQAGNNDLLVAVKLMLFREQSGALGLPLIDIPVEKIRETPPAEPEEN